MYFKTSLLTTLLGLSINFGFAQNVEFTKENFKDQKEELKAAKKDIEKADEFMNLESYYFKNAIPLYLNAYIF
jgi:hypothetical protein